MPHQEPAPHLWSPPSTPALYGAAATMGVIAFATSPALAHFAGAIVPWPAHGLCAALVMAAPPERRVRVTLACALALLVGLAPVALTIQPTGGIVRLIAAVALLILQALVITLLYERIAGDVSPLSGTSRYASMLLAVVLGAIPTTIVASLLVRFSGGIGGASYSGWAWWLAAASSGAALIGAVLALLSGGGTRRVTRARVIEFFVMLLGYGVMLAMVFAEAGPMAGRLLPSLAALPFLVWAGLRYGTRGIAVIALLLVVVVTVSTWFGLGPIGRTDPDQIDRFRRVWVYLASLLGPAMIFPVAIEEREEAERRARSALAQLRALFESTGDLIAAVDRDLVLIAANPAWRNSFLRLTGIHAESGRRVRDLFASLGADGELSIALWKRALAGEAFTIERFFGLPDRGREEFEVSYAPVRDDQGDVVGASHVLRSISDRRRREAESAEARRLEGLGRLAGGVAHDFNNLMASVGGYAELLLDDLAPDDARRADVLEIQAVARRAASLTQQLLAFARRREVHPQDVDAAELLQGMAGLLRPLLGTGIALDLAVPSACPRIRIDPTQLEQVVLNLVVNARDAMAGGGRIRVALTVLPDDRRGALELSVSDTGEGMPPEVQARIFEPFFTTKASGKGTGLGLATVHGIVHQAGGTIGVESVTGHGTTFRVVFPLSLAPPGLAPEAASGVTPTPV